MGSCVTETLSRLLLQLSEVEPPALLWGSVARRHHGAGFERLLDTQILIEQRPATEWPVCSSCECDLDMRPLLRIAGKLVAACPLDHRKDETLDDDDLRSFLLDHSALLREIVRVSGFESSPSEISSNLWSLGMAEGVDLFLTYHGSVAGHHGTVNAIRLTARTHPVLISPRLSAADRLALDRAQIRSVELRECLRIAPGHVIPILQIDRPIAVRSVPRLVVYIQNQSIMLDGKKQKLPPRSFKLIFFLAKEAVAGRPLCERRDIEKHLWKTVVSEKAVADAIRDLRKKIAPILPDGMLPKQFIENRTPALYLITLPPNEISIEDGTG